MASKKSKDKRAKHGKTAKKSDLDVDGTETGTNVACRRDLEIDCDTELELTELMKEMALTGSKTETAKSIDDIDGVRHEPVPYIPRNVLYYGWFFGETVSSTLRSYANDYLHKCMSEIPNFQDFIQHTCQTEDIMDYFRKPKSSSKSTTYHITAKFCGRTSDEVYENRAAGLIGKVFDLHIIGVFITKSTLGYRVELQEEQMDLFDDERKFDGRRKEPSSPDRSEDSPRNSPIRHTPGTSKTSCNSGCTKKSKKTISSTLPDLQPSHPDYPGLLFMEQSINLQPTSTRAHITLGCAPKVKAFRTGEDLLDIIDLERQAASKPTDVFSFDVRDIHAPNRKSILRQFGRQHGDAFVIYFNHKIVAKAVFMAYA